MAYSAPAYGLIASIIFALGFCNAAPAPPVWPNAFTVSGNESWYYVERNGNQVLEGTCNLTQYYDYTNSRMRYDRSAGQVDYFCQMNVKKSIQCNLYFDSSSAMFVDYPTINYCCRLCHIDEGCSVLKPTWIENGHYDGQEKINGRTCDVWSEQGVSTVDHWSQDSDKIPCEYWETKNTYLMTNMYDPNSYVVGEPNATLFVLPSSDCHNVCNVTAR